MRSPATHSPPGVMIMMLVLTHTAIGGPRLDFAGELLTPEVHPFGAARFRLTLTNTGDEPSIPLIPQEFSIEWIETESEWPEFGGTRGRRRHKQWTPSAQGLFPSDPRSQRVGEGGTGLPKIVLQPGESVSVSFVLQVHRERRLRPVFPAPGRYRVKFEYDLWTDLLLSEIVLVEVAPATGPDAEVLRQLIDDTELARVVLSPYQPLAPAQVGPARQLLARYPDSAYAPYLHYALARTQIGGVRPLESTATDRRAAALQRLSEIDLKDFPLAPHALFMSKRLLDDPRKIGEIQERIQRDSSDALELIFESRPTVRD